MVYMCNVIATILIVDIPEFLAIQYIHLDVAFYCLLIAYLLKICYNIVVARKSETLKKL